MGDALSLRYDYVELYCDSLGANQSNDSGALTTDWPRFYFTQKNFRPAGLKIISANIPFVFDTITADNNLITLVISAVEYPLYITPGTYTGPDLATELSTLLSTVSATAVVWNPDTFRFAFTGVVDFSLILPQVCADIQLGFKTGTWNSTSNILVSPFAAAPSGPSYLYLNSQTIGPVVHGHIQDGENRVNQLCRIPITVQKGGWIFYSDPNPEQFFDFLPQSFNVFDLYLTLGYDQATVPLSLKGLGFSVKIAILNYREGGVPIGQRPTSSQFLTG